MLKQLDTLIAFVVVMSVVSLLITIAVQMISALLGLRGLNLRDSIEAMISRIDPSISPNTRSLLSKYLLTRPATSDSTLSMANSWWDRLWIIKLFRGRWKNAAAIRADELLDLLKDLAGCRENVMTQPTANTTKAGPEVLKMFEALNDLGKKAGWWRRARATLLGRVAGQGPVGRDSTKKAADDAFKAANTAVSSALQDLVTAAGSAVAALKANSTFTSAVNNATHYPTSPGATESEAKALLLELEGLQADDAVKTVVGNAVRALQGLGVAREVKVFVDNRQYSEVKKAINNGASKIVDNTLTSVAQTLLLTLQHPPADFDKAKAAILSGLAELAKQKGAAVIQEFDRANNLALYNLERWFNSAQDRAQQWFAMHTRQWTVFFAFVAAIGLQLDSIELLKRASSDEEFRNNLVKLASAQAFTKQMDLVMGTNGIDMVDTKLHLVALGVVTNTYTNLNVVKLKTLQQPTTLQAAMDGLASQLTDIIADSGLRTRITNAYCQVILRKKLEGLGDSFNEVVQVSQAAGLQLVPEPYPAKNRRFWPATHLLGMLLSAALLTLGAPFWFNLLKSLTNLRPMLAEKVDQNPRQVPAALGTGAK